MAEGGDRPQPVRRGALLGLLALALAARLPNLDAGLWFDEVWLVVLQLRKPFAELATTYDSDNLHPLYALLAWPCVRAFGEVPWAARLPALVFGAAAVPAVYALGARSGSARAGVWAAVLLALSPHAVAFSQSARGYTGLLLFTVLACLGFREALRGGGARAVLLQGVALALATHVHLTGVFLGLAQLVAALLELRRSPGARAALAGVLAGGLLSLALHAPILAPMAEFFTRERDAFAATRAVWKSPRWMLEAAAGSFGLGLPAGAALLATGALVALVGLGATWRRDRALALLAVLPGLLGQGAMWALGRNLWPRFFFALAGLWLLVFVAGGLWLSRALRAERLADAGLLAAALASALLCVRVWTLPKQDFASAVAFVEERRGPDVAVLSAGQAMFPLRDWLGTDHVPLEDPATLERELAGKRAAYVVTSSEVFTSAYYPAVWELLSARGAEVARFRAQAPDQDVVVLELRP